METITKDNYKTLCKRGWGWDRDKGKKEECWLYAIYCDTPFKYRVFYDSDFHESCFRNFEEIKEDTTNTLEFSNPRIIVQPVGDEKINRIQLENGVFITTFEKREEEDQELGWFEGKECKTVEDITDPWYKDNIVKHLAGLRVWANGEACPFATPLTQDKSTDSGVEFDIPTLKSGEHVFSPYHSKPYEEWLTAEEILEQSK